MHTSRLAMAFVIVASLAPLLPAKQPEAAPAGSGPGVTRGVGYYDRQMRRVVLAGGAALASGERDRVWSWSGTRWELLTDAGPPSRTNGAAAFDVASGRGIISGGTAMPAQQRIVSGDTWRGDGRTWARIGDHPARDHQALVTDGRGRVLMFAGIPADRSAPWPTDTLELRGDAWVTVATEGPQARGRTAMAYDAKRQQVVLFGGVSASPGPKVPQNFLNDTWIWENGTWRQAAVEGPRGRYAHGMVYDERAGVVLLYSGAAAHKGAPLTDMWQWDGARWSEIALTGPTPGYRYQPIMVYDSARQRTVLYGGIEGSRDDTWEWDGKMWREVRP